MAIRAYTLTKSQANDIWTLLVQECGVREDRRQDFIDYVAEPGRTWAEYRFMGSLGLGGKFYLQYGRIWVNCYMEDETPELNAVIQKVNKLLEGIKGDA